MKTANISFLPQGKSPAPAPVPVPHFPDRLHAVVWRNCELVPVERLAKVLRATPAQICALAASMGLLPSVPLPPEIERRLYITLIRRNWHLLPYEQLIELLDWDEAKLAFTLREDDFLWHKLGLLKPACDPVHFQEPSPAARQRAAEIRRIVAAEFGGALPPAGERPLGFLAELTTARPDGQPSVIAAPVKSSSPDPSDNSVELRFIYSYFALYGDPLLDPACDPYPEDYLARLAELGVNGVWLQGILHKLVPWKLAPGLADRYEERQSALRRLVERAARHGIGVYLYFNEPRAMPLAFYEEYPLLRGVREDDFAALCTSTPEVRDFLTASAAALFAAVPGLAGAFTISMSENLTNCYSRGRGHDCPRCRQRPPAEVVAEVNRCLAEGVWRSRPDARFLVWDWGWANEWAEAAIAQLPPPAWLMSVSEWSLPIRRGGISSAVGEYSISAPGPGPRALRHWAAARRRGLKIAAKVQLNNTWELSAVPYIPALDLVAEHLGHLTAAGGPGVNGLMLGWTLGGYPSPNLDLLAEFSQKPAPDVATAVAAVARRRFGEAAAPQVMAAWRQFSDAFREFPYHSGVMYAGPQQMGPANLLFRQPTGYRATMVCFPYDDLEAWRAIYPPAVLQQQFETVAAGWKKGLNELEAAFAVTPVAPALAAEWRVAKAAWLHFRSVANQAAFVRFRSEDWPRCRPILADELLLAKELFALVNGDSRLGFEATNHYYYTRLDLVEKILNCRQLLDA